MADDKLRMELHRPRIREGARFFCHDGLKRVAEGRVTKILALNEERPAC
jgi:hypothetical protein